MQRITAGAGSTAIGSIESNLGRDIEPHEATICESLIEQIVCSSRAAATHHEQPTAQTSPLARTLLEVAATIQFHAKWFAPGPLSTLYQTALDVASRSTSTNDLFSALELIRTIATYSHLPSVLPAARFIALAYYQGSRSNRHRRLSHFAWTIAQHILESHLGGQFVGNLLDIICNNDHFRSKAKFGSTIGALMITEQKLLSNLDQDFPSMQPTQILLGLKNAAIGENPILREQVAVTLSSMLLDDQIFERIDHDGGLSVCLDLAQRCAHLELDQAVRDALFKGLELRFADFEPRDQPPIARLYVDAHRPLPSAVSAQLLTPWRSALMMGDAHPWENDYRDMLSYLCDGTTYLNELEAFLDIAGSAYFRLQSQAFRRDFVETLETLILDPAVEHSVRDILSDGLVGIFTHKMRKAKWEGERNWLFPLLCRLSVDCVNITDILLRIRADASGSGYVEAAPSQNPEELTEKQRGYPSIHGLSSLAMENWEISLRNMIITSPSRWDVYERLLMSMGAQFRNHALWSSRPRQINSLRQALCDRLNSDSFVEPPASTGLGKSYVVSHLIQILTAMTSYHNQLSRSEIKAAILTFINVAGSREYTVSIQCIHALTICCYELPEVMAGYMDAIISKMSKMVTQRHLAIFVLEFLAGLSRLPVLQETLDTQSLKRIFGVCHSYLQTMRSSAALERRRTPTSERSAGGSTTANDDMAQYVYALAHHVITFWYVALKRSHRRELKEFITGCLKYTDADGHERIEEQGIVTIDLMDRIDSEDVGSPPEHDSFDEVEGHVTREHQLRGLLLITSETAERAARTIVTIRRPSGTVQKTIDRRRTRHYTGRRDDDDEALSASATVENDAADYISVFTDDFEGQSYGRVTVPRAESALGSDETINLPDHDPSVRRAIDMFDRVSALDSHKVGVIYVGEGQKEEKEILLNQSGSPDYREFLNDLGTLRKLKGATFNTQGLDRFGDADGEHTIVWNNDVTELVYHITTFMPFDPIDEHTTVINKKRHIGNDFVNIVFNNSGAPFLFNTFPSQFNAVYIVISPSERTSFLQARTITIRKEKKDRFYNVRVLTRPDYPNLAAASEEKVVSGASLGGFVRNLALNACVFSAMWSAGNVAEYESSWRRRLQMLKRLADQHRPRSVASSSTRSTARALPFLH